MPNHKIAALVGMCGSGKSVVCDMFVEKGWNRIYFGGVTMDELTRRGLPKNEANERSIREELRREYGPAAFAKILLPSIEKSAEEGPTILDGLYSWSEYKCLKEHFGDDITIIAVITDRAVRNEVHGFEERRSIRWRKRRKWRLDHKRRKGQPRYTACSERLY